MSKNNISNGKYQHYKNHQLYEVIGFAIHAETLEEMVIYKSLYALDKFAFEKIWVRPKEMFFETVEYDGNFVPRFKRIE